MGPEYYLKSIARTIVFHNGKFTRKRDCHSVTACYVSSDLAKDSDLIVLLGSEEGDMVFHSIVLNAAHDIVSDSFPGYKLIKYDKKTITVTYDGPVDEPVKMTPVKMITVNDFKNKYIKTVTEDNRMNFKKFLSESHLQEAAVSLTNWKMSKIPAGIDHAAVTEQLEELFMTVFSPLKGYAIEKIKEPPCYVPPADDKKDAGKAVLSYTVNVTKSVSTSAGGHSGRIDYNMYVSVRPAFKDGKIFSVSASARSAEKRSGFSTSDKSYDLGSYTKTSIEQLMSALKKIKSLYDEPIKKVEDEMKTVKSKPLNLLHNLKPSKVVEGDKEQMAAMRQFGGKLRKLVDKYSEFNRENDIVPAGYYGAAKLSSARSGSIVFKFEHIHQGGQYGITRPAWAAVLIGTNYPSDKADMFTLELIKLINTSLPTEIPVEQKDGTSKPSKVHLQTELGGTNYKTFMVYF